MPLIARPAPCVASSGHTREGSLAPRSAEVLRGPERARLEVPDLVTSLTVFVCPPSAGVRLRASRASSASTVADRHEHRRQWRRHRRHATVIATRTTVLPLTLAVDFLPKMTSWPAGIVTTDCASTLRVGSSAPRARGERRPQGPPAVVTGGGRTGERGQRQRERIDDRPESRAVRGARRRSAGRKQATRAYGPKELDPSTNTGKLQGDALRARELHHPCGQMLVRVAARPSKATEASVGPIAMTEPLSDRSEAASTSWRTALAVAVPT